MAILPVGIGASGPTQFQIERSLRFNSADSAYLNRTPASDGNRKTWTLSTWAKISAFGSQVFIMGAGVDGDNRTDIRIDGDSLQFANIVSNVTNANIKTSAVYRDPSAWYHIVIAVDSTQATSTNRIKIYVNGTEVTAFSTSTYFSQNTDTYINDNSGHTIGRYSISGSNYFNGYLADFYLIDGQALTPSDFGENDTDTGVWKPKAYSGTYGTNGFYLKFADNSGTTSTTLGKDSSGNGNNWTPNNFSVTAGAGNDSLVDTPTPYGSDTGAGGEVRGNYCTLNPFLRYVSLGVPTNGNLDITGNNGNWRSILGTIGVSSGKWYVEFTVQAAGTDMAVGIINLNDSAEIYQICNTDNRIIGRTTTGISYLNNGNKYTNNSSSSYGASWTTNDVIGVALDMDAGTVAFYKNGSSQGTALSSLSGNFTFGVSTSTSTVFTANFGQRPFAYTAPSGFKALCTTNLPTPAIGATSTTRADDYFNTLTYTGTTQSPRTLTGVGFQPDFVWVKNRSDTYGHYLWDAVRGTDNNLRSDGTFDEASVSAAQNGIISTSASDGFTVKNGGTGGLNVGSSGTNSYVAWNWKANGSGSSNTQGSITSTVSANTTSGFSIVTYTGNGTGGATIGHGLGVAPSMVITKARNTADLSWLVYHRSVGPTGFLLLNTTGGVSTNPAAWNDTNPTSTVFTAGTGSSVNGSGTTYVAYCFAPVAGYSAFGSYIGGGTTPTFVYTGFRPRYIMIKCTTAPTGYESWFICDTARNTYNSANAFLSANTSGAEGVGSAGSNYIDIVSNGFRTLGNGSSAPGIDGNSGATYVYAAFAEHPFKYALAR